MGAQYNPHSQENIGIGVGTHTCDRGLDNSVVTHYSQIELRL